MAWVPFEAREASLQQQIGAAAAATKPVLSPGDFYNQHDLGLMDSSQLSTWLAGSVIQEAVGAVQPKENPDPPQEISESEALDARSLRWLRLNGRTAADKTYAKRCYRRLLFELWRKHIADTGQTYYPELRDDLMDHFQLLLDQDDLG